MTITPADIALLQEAAEQASILFHDYHAKLVDADPEYKRLLALRYATASAVQAAINDKLQSDVLEARTWTTSKYKAGR